MGKNVSVRDVAREAGVSIGSVSRVLNGGPHVSQDLRERVYSVVERLGYRANVHARGLRTGSSRIVGCMVPEIRNQIYASFVGAVEARLNASGYMMLLGNSHGSAPRERQLLAFFESHGVDGIIATPGSKGEDFLRGPFGAGRTPLVVLDRDVDGACDAVLIDQEGGVRAATQHLIGLGHRRIALFTGGVGLRSGRGRIQGWRDAHRARGLPADDGLIGLVSAWSQSSYDDMRAMLRLPEPPTAVIAPSTRVLSGALKAVRDAGLAWPVDFSAVAIGATDAGEFAWPELTTVAWDAEASGRLACELLLARLEPSAQAPSRPVPAQRLLLDTWLQQGQSCGPAPRASRRR
ncbi:MAG: Catabolite control protein A [Paracidovorax wautersii]|uniref:Catabolite control protein A n=1 Tax=Paracidovorax wautersii TaxID=1177982 RepID=A0A7V8FS10_9BURK|nr:MAG: Catabolite control protein A [Paracidovorax wautersii]